MTDAPTAEIAESSKLLYVNNEQQEIITRFMEVYGPHMVYYGPNKCKETFNRLWEECAAKLNVAGPARSAKQWRNHWVKWKFRIKKRRSVLLNKQKKNLDIAESQKLTPIEERIIALMDDATDNKK